MSTDRGMDKDNVVHIHSGILFGHKKELNNAIFSNMDGPRDYHTKWSIYHTKSDRERQISHTAYMWNLKKEKKYKWTYLQNRKNHRLWKQTYGYQRGNMGGKDKLGVWD